jgi:hypothetical protein
MDHEPRQVRGMSDSGIGDVHEVVPSPVLLGVTEVEHQLEAQAAVVLELMVGEFQVAAEEDDRRPGVCMQVGLADADDIQRVRERLVEPWGLVEAGLDGACDGGGVEIHSRDVAVIQLAAILATWATPSIRAFVGHRYSRVSASRGDARHTARWGHVQGVGVATVPIEPQIGQRDRRGDQMQEGFAQVSDPHHLWRQRDGGRGLGLTTLRTPQATSGGGRWRLLRFRFRLADRVLRGAADDRLNAAGARAPFLDADPREREDGQPGHYLAVQTGKEPI